ncbi:MAG TPA: hypothetical protein VF432_24940 [Thermoanaerobaculia bacterium]
MIDSLRSLAARINGEWKSAGAKVSALPAIAARILEDAQPHREYDGLASLAGWTLSSRTFPQPCNPFGPQGPPAFTIWSDGCFFANIYAYTTPEVVIHDHDFAGAFTNLSGTTIHATYAFPDAERVAPEVHVGELAVREVEVVRTGDVRRIDPGRRFIHQVWHVDQPTVVLVLRTGPLPAPRRQFQYLRAGFATEVFRDGAMSVDAPERFRYTRKMAECLRTSSDGGMDYLKLLVRQDRPWDAVWHLVGNWRYLRSLGALDDLVRLGIRHQGAWFAGVADAGSEHDLFSSIQWASMPSVQDRIALALLMTYRGWRPIREWLERLLPPGAAPEDRFVESLAKLGDEGLIPLRLDPQGQAMLGILLRSDGNRAAWRRAVRESFAIEERGDWATAGAIERALREHRLLQPLFVNPS